MTIEQLLVKEGRWPNTRGPKRSRARYDKNYRDIYRTEPSSMSMTYRFENGKHVIDSISPTWHPK